MDELYRVVISGSTRSGRALADVRNDVGQALRLQGEQLDRMLCGQVVAVAKNKTGEEARKLLLRLHELDLEAVIQPMPSASSTPATRAAPQPPLSASSTANNELFALSTPGAPPTPATPPAAKPIPDKGAALSLQDAEGLVLATAPTDESTICPKCGEQQPKRTLCRQCGLDMQRFRTAQAEAGREAREERAFAEKNRSPGPLGESAGHPLDGAPGLVGIGFSGRLGRISYINGMIISTLVLTVFFMLAFATSKSTFALLGSAISLIYSLRIVALRLHDIGKSGWLCLMAFVPAINALMTFLLLLLPGDRNDNEFGLVPDKASGLGTVLLFVALVAMLGMMAKNMSKSPEQTLKYTQIFGEKSTVASKESSAKEMVYAEVRVQRSIANRQFEMAYFGKMENDLDCQRHSEKIKLDMIRNCEDCVTKTACKGELPARYAMLFDDTPSSITYLSMNKGMPNEREGRIVFWGITVDESNQVCDALKKLMAKTQTGLTQCIRAKEA